MYKSLVVQRTQQGGPWLRCLPGDFSFGASVCCCITVGRNLGPGSRGEPHRLRQNVGKTPVVGGKCTGDTFSSDMLTATKIITVLIVCLDVTDWWFNRIYHKINKLPWIINKKSFGKSTKLNHGAFPRWDYISR